MSHLRIASLAVVSCLACSCASGGATDAPSVGERERTQHTSMQIEVVSIEDAVRAARRATESHAGYTEQSTIDERYARLELRVPSESLEDLRAALTALGHVTHASDEAEDVTREHADQELQLASARAEEARLTEMFASRAVTLADVLAVEHELARVRAEVERLDAAEQSLRSRIRMARVSLDLARQEPSFASEPTRFLASAAIHGAQLTFVLLLCIAWLIAFLAPSALMVVLLARTARFIRRRA